MQRKLIPLFIVFTGLTFISCAKDQKLTDNIIGNYYSTLGTSENTDNLTYNYFFEKEEEFLVDHSLNVKFISEVNVYDYDGGYNSVSYEIAVQGSWNIKDSKLQCKYDIDKASWKMIKVFYNNEIGTSKFFDLFEILRDQLILPKLKELDTTHSDKSLEILDINSKELILKDLTGKSISKIKLSNEQPINDIKNFTHKADIGFDFELFMNKFTTNKEFQFSRIKFPISDMDSQIITSKTWVFMSKESFHIGEYVEDENVFVGEFIKSAQKDEVFYRLAIPETDNGILITFRKINNNWTLVSYK